MNEIMQIQSLCMKQKEFPFKYLPKKIRSIGIDRAVSRTLESIYSKDIYDLVSYTYSIINATMYQTKGIVCGYDFLRIQISEFNSVIYYPKTQTFDVNWNSNEWNPDIIAFSMDKESDYHDIRKKIWIHASKEVEIKCKEIIRQILVWIVQGGGILHE